MTDTLDHGPPVIVAELTVAEGESTVIDWGQFVRIELSACHGESGSPTNSANRSDVGR